MQVKFEKKIKRIKEKLYETGLMRPGSLTKQYQDPKNKKGGYYQLSYTYRMKSKTEYIRPEYVKDVRQQIKNYKRFRCLVKQLLDLSISYSRSLMNKK